MARELTVSEGSDMWRKILTQGHPPVRILQHLFRYLPSPPRCKVCHNPFGGFGGKLVALFGFTRSRKNPNLCAFCCEKLPPGGAELDIAVLFADVRGSTTMGEQMSPGEYASILNRFYSAATDVLVRHDAIIDKLIGDEVMALFLPGFCGSQYRKRAVDAGVALFKALGYGSGNPWLAIGGAINSGVAYVGNVGGENVVDFTALGDAVNTASRLASSAPAGEILLSEATYQSVADQFPNLEHRVLTLRGKDAPVDARVIGFA